MAGMMTLPDGLLIGALAALVIVADGAILWLVSEWR